MIKLTLYNGSDVIVNADLIELVERTPDTLVTLTTGKKVMVKESVEDVVKKAIDYHRLVAGNRRLPRSKSRIDIMPPAEGSETWM